MRLFWYDGVSGRGVKSCEARAVTLSEVQRVWADEVRGVHNSFLGLIDDAGRTIQFAFEEDIPDNVDDTTYLKIVLVDFPCLERKGSFAATVTVGEVYRWMRDAFERGADPALFDGLSFKPGR